MSASAPGRSRNPRSGEPTVRRSAVRLRQRREGHWFLVSMALHAVAFAVLIYMTPVRELVRQLRQPVRPEKTMSAVGLSDLTEAIEKYAARQISLNTKALGGILREIGSIQNDIGRKFVEFERRRRQKAPQEALEAMEKAVDLMSEAVSAIENGDSVELIDRLQASAEHAQERAGRKLELLRGDVSTIVSGQKAAAEAHQQAKAAHDAHGRQTVEVARLERALATQRQRTAQAENTLQQYKESGRPEATIEAQTKRVEQEQQAVAAAEEALKAAQQAAERMHQEAAESQKLALAAQKRVAEALREAIERGRARGGDTEAIGLPGVISFDDSSLSGGDEGADLAELYNRARALEDSVAETFKEVRAMDLAMVRDISLEQARNDIDLIRPVRPDLNEELLREPARTDASFEAHKEEVRTALRETNSMVNLAHRMLEMASESVAKMKFGTSVDLAPEGEPVDFRLIIRELATEDVVGRFSNLADVMKALEEQRGEGTGGRAGPAGTGSPGGSGRPGVDYEDLTAEELASLGRLPDFGREGMGDNAEMPALTPDMVKVGARKVTGNGIPTDWFYIDTWYTIGPFPNPNRINIDREFPPDSLVDLDATYVGKGGRRIRWQFVQSDKPEIIPANAEPYGIWYAYTEFYCDRPMDVLIAMGTDDRGTLKINGVPVWISSKRLKGWTIGEAWRRVHFNRGVNRILYRIENGWQHVAFSLVMRLEEP